MTAKVIALGPRALSDNEVLNLVVNLSVERLPEDELVRNDIHLYLGAMLPELVEGRIFLRWIYGAPPEKQGEVLSWEESVDALVRHVEDHYRIPGKPNCYYQEREVSLGRNIPVILRENLLEFVH